MADASQIIKDSNGELSSKRVYAAAALLAMFVCLGAALFFGRVIPEFIFDGFKWIALGLTLGTLPEWFAPKKE